MTQIRIDTRAYFSFWGKYLWVFYFCLIYRFLFETGLSRPAISLNLNHDRIDFSLFLISGISLIHLVTFSVKSIDETISDLRRSGIISWVLITPTSLHELFLVRWIWGFFLSITELTATIIFGRFLIGTPIWLFFQGSAFFAFFLMSLAYAGIGMGIAALSLSLRRGGFLCSVVHQASVVFGGVFFPTYLFPNMISFISQVLPITHALNIVRYALIHAGQSVPFSLFSPLMQMSLLYFLSGLWILQKSLCYAKQNGLLLKDLHE